MPESKLVQIKTKDGLMLPGLLYEVKRSKKAAIYLHGNGSASVFYNIDKHEAKVRELAKKGISILLFNNRGAHIAKRLTVKKGKKEKKKLFGMAYEKIKECALDIDGALDYLNKRGYRTFYLIGESTGANKICVYHYYKPKNKVAKYVLLGGGDDFGIYYDYLGIKRFLLLLKEAKRKVKKRQGEEIMKELVPDLFFSYQGFYDIANPNGDYNVFPFLEEIKHLSLSKRSRWRHFKSLNKPTLVVYGSEDEYAWGNIPKIIDLLKKQKPELDYKIINVADHSFSNKPKELARLIAGWL